VYWRPLSVSTSWGAPTAAIPRSTASKTRTRPLVVSQRVTDAEPPRVQGHAARATELRYLARWSLSFSDLAIAVRQCLEVREQTLGSGTRGDGVTGGDGDHHGSPVVVTDARGEVIREKAYHPYGSTRCERADAADPFAYVGNEQDQGSGLSDFSARP
jgi:hypothetical protein